MRKWIIAGFALGYALGPGGVQLLGVEGTATVGALLVFAALMFKTWKLTA